MIKGLYRLQPDSADPLSPKGLTLLDSYEAGQHVAHLGRSESPVCWTICGLISGYLSCVLEREIYVLEERCVGRATPPAISWAGRARSGATLAPRSFASSTTIT